MLISKEKRQKNIAEYIIYMWQIEDLIRIFDFNVDAIMKNVIKANNSIEESYISEYKKWYSDIIEMMIEERIKKQGHLQIITNLINDLNNLHRQIIKEKIDKLYIQIYKQALPNIIEFKKKIKLDDNNEIEIIFNALHFLLLMRMQKKEISDGTNKAMKTFSQLLAYLTKKYHKIEEDSQS